MLSEVLSCPIRWLPVEKAPMDPSYWTESYRLAKTTFFLFLFCRGGGGGSPKNCSHVYWARVFWPIWKFYLGRTLAQFHRSPDAKELHPPARTQGGGLKNGRSEGPNAHIFESSRVGPLGRSRACTSRAPNGKKKKKEKKKKRILQTDRRLVPGKNAPARKISCLGLSSRASYEKFWKLFNYIKIIII